MVLDMVDTLARRPFNFLEIFLFSGVYLPKSTSPSTFKVDLLKLTEGESDILSKSKHPT